LDENIYLKLREHLDSFPGGFPSTENGVELKILRKLFTPQEAEMFLRMSLVPEPVSAVADRSGMDETQVAALLESMAGNGLLYRIRTADDVYYMANMFVIGVYEFSLNVMDRELAEMMEEYLPHLKLVPKQVRVVPVDAAVDSTPSVASYDLVREMVKGKEVVAVAPCICRKEKGLLGHDCARPLETCLTFDQAAEYYIENGLGHRITNDEALDVLARAEESALVLMPNNAVHIMNICCCCSCCCGVLRVLSSFDRPADEVQSTFQASIDPDLCIACGTCIERCQIEAIDEGDDYMQVNEARCIGCGLCLTTCTEEAISLVERTGIEPPPANVVVTRIKIAQERGL
jgi:H+/Na+-translocating ferredoxin:NAD+ oxidoreductase subunit B